ATMTEKASISRQLVLSACVLVALGVGGFLLVRRSTPAFSEAAPTSRTDALTVSATGHRVLQIETEPVRVQALERDIQATGLLSCPADESIKISPRVQGRIRQVFVRVGDHVKTGQTLAILDSADAASAITTARQAENKARLTRSNLERQQRLYKLGTPDVT